jgi:hypothetical protein
LGCFVFGSFRSEGVAEVSDERLMVNIEW